MKKCTLVCDIGGTTTRAGIFSYEQQGLIDVVKEPSANFLTANLPNEKLANLLIEKIENFVYYYTRRHPEFNFSHIGISFPGPVTPEGTVIQAPTLWGSEVRHFPLKKILLDRLKNHQVTVINDITAAGFRYIDRFDGTFCIITVSSGIGCKVFWKKQVLLNNKGLGGEIGHQYYQSTFNNLVCDCGDEGHIGAMSSGRGIERMARLLSQVETKLPTNPLLHQAKNFSTFDIVQALERNEEFAEHVLRECIRPIATAISYLYSFIGIERFIFIGGVVNALRERYTDLLKNELMDEKYLWGVSDSEVEEMIVLGENDDDHGLYGVGKYVQAISC